MGCSLAGPRAPPNKQINWPLLLSVCMPVSLHDWPAPKAHTQRSSWRRPNGACHRAPAAQLNWAPNSAGRTVRRAASGRPTRRHKGRAPALSLGAPGGKCALCAIESAHCCLCTAQTVSGRINLGTIGALCPPVMHWCGRLFAFLGVLCTSQASLWDHPDGFGTRRCGRRPTIAPSCTPTLSLGHSPQRLSCTEDSPPEESLWTARVHRLRC